MMKTIKTTLPDTPEAAQIRGIYGSIGGGMQTAAANWLYVRRQMLAQLRHLFTPEELRAILHLTEPHRFYPVDAATYFSQLIAGGTFAESFRSTFATIEPDHLRPKLYQLSPAEAITLADWANTWHHRRGGQTCTIEEYINAL